MLKSFGNKDISNIFEHKNMVQYFCIGFINFMLNKKLIDFTNLFSPKKFSKIKIILKYFQ